MVELRAYQFYNAGFFGYGEKGNFVPWSICLTMPALFVPSVLTFTGPQYFRYYQYWMEHGLPLIAVFYMMFVRGKRPKYRHLWLAMGLLVLLSIPCVIANSTIPDANYMYLGNYAEGSTQTVDPLSFLPGSQMVRYLIMMALTIGLFHLAYLVEQRIVCRKKKEQPERRTAEG